MRAEIKPSKTMLHLDSNDEKLHAYEYQDKLNNLYYYKYMNIESGLEGRIYAETLEELRSQKKQIKQEQKRILKETKSHINVTLETIYSQWLQLRLREMTLGKISLKTYNTHKRLLTLYIPIDWYKRNITSFDYNQILALYLQILKSRDILPDTIIKVIHAPLRQIFQLAVDYEFIYINPTVEAVIEFRIITNRKQYVSHVQKYSKKICANQTKTLDKKEKDKKEQPKPKAKPAYTAHIYYPLIPSIQHNDPRTLDTYIPPKVYSSDRHDLYKEYDSTTKKFRPSADLITYERNIYKNLFKEILRDNNTTVESMISQNPPQETIFQIDIKQGKKAIQPKTIIRLFEIFFRTYKRRILSKNKAYTYIRPLTLAYHFNEKGTAFHIHMRYLFVHHAGNKNNCNDNIITDPEYVTKCLGLKSVDNYNQIVRKLFVEAAIIKKINIEPTILDKRIFTDPNRDPRDYNERVNEYNQKVKELRKSKK